MIRGAKKHDNKIAFGAASLIGCENLHLEYNDNWFLLVDFEYSDRMVMNIKRIYSTK